MDEGACRTGASQTPGGRLSVVLVLLLLLALGGAVVGCGEGAAAGGDASKDTTAVVVRRDTGGQSARNGGNSVPVGGQPVTGGKSARKSGKGKTSGKPEDHAGKTAAGRKDCAPGYRPCIPPYPPDLNCSDIGHGVLVTGSDPHGLDLDGNGHGCESYGPAPDVPDKGSPNPGRPAGSVSGSPKGPDPGGCTTPRKVQTVTLDRKKYRPILRHIREAIRDGWPRITRINRAGAGKRRNKALAGIPTKPGYDRDEWPMAMARNDWRASVKYVDSSVNRSAGASVGAQLRKFCSGTRFRIVATG